MDALAPFQYFRAKYSSSAVPLHSEQAPLAVGTNIHIFIPRVILTTTTSFFHICKGKFNNKKRYKFVGISQSFLLNY